MNLHTTLGFRIQKNKKPSRTKPSPSQSSSTRLPSLGPCPSPIAPLRTTLLAHQHALAHLFDPIPPSLTSTHTAHLLQTRLAIPPLVSTSHIQSLLSLTPTAAERELSNLLQANTLRRITVPRRGAIGDLAILSADLNSIIRSHVALDDATKSSFISWLSTNPTAQTLPPDTLAASQLDALVRTGFLTALLHDSTGAGAQTLLRARPEDHSTLLSLSAVSRAAAGTLAAVGGDGAVHSAGGSGVRSTSNTNNGSRGLGLGLSITVPGIGTYLKLVAAALGHLRGLLEKTAYSEMAERDLRERWEGGVPTDVEVARAKKARGEFAGVFAGRTKKWKELNGVGFEWVLCEAVGAGLVELFETGSVGRGVRLVGDGAVY